MKLDGLLKEYRESLPEAPAMDFEQLAKRERKPAAGWWMAGIAAACVAMVWLWPQEQPRPRVVERIALPVPNVETHEVLPEMPDPAVRKVARKKRQVPQEVEGFVAIGEASMLPQPAAFQVLRVSVSGPRLVALGVLRADQIVSSTMTADVLMGDDGMARAIRVVQNE